MLNQTLCDSDKQKQAHLTQIDFYLKKLFSFRRLSVDVFIKLEALREEDETNNTRKFLKTLKAATEEEQNFFLDESADAEQNKGFEDVNMSEEGDIMGEDVQSRYEKDCERGYFLQPIYVQKIKRKIYFYDELVGDMLKEFHSRVMRKRLVIEQVKLKCKEISIRDTMVICERCKQDIAMLKTVDYVKDDLHFAKCVFGTLKRVEVDDALTQKYSEDRDFISLYMELNQEEQLEGDSKEAIF